MGELAGTVSASDSRYILLTDICSSSRICEAYPQAYAQVLDRHNVTTEEAIAACSGEVYRSTGDGYMAFFDDARDCFSCLVSLQRQFAAFPAFSANDPFLVRAIGHGGPIRNIGGALYGAALNRSSRICQVCHPGQALISAPVVRQLAGRLAEDTALVDLGEHHLRDLGEPEHLYQVDNPDFVRHKFPPLPTLSHRPNNLLAQPNAFFGRARELAELARLLLADRRLVTITAPGGYGKSRLAVHLCSDLLERFERGVYVVLLAPLRDHSSVAAAIAGAIGFQFYGNRDPQEQLIDHLREKHLLLCLDNFEHVMPATSFVSELLGQAPQLRAIVTSREPLRIAGEQVYPLEPLPANMGRPTVLNDAMELFVDRASLAKPDLDLSADSLQTVRRICQRLDGVPLAIELAAAWADSYSLAELLAEMEQQLELTARLRDVPERHRSVRASLDWSYNMLSTEQQSVLRHLAMFKGGFFIEAAEAVLAEIHQPALLQESAGAAPAAIADTTAVNSAKQLRLRLTELSDKSWLYTREVRGRTRFFMRDAASREYALEKLQDTPAWQDAINAHARYFAELTSREGAKLTGPQQTEAFNQLQLELENIYEGADTALGGSDVELLLCFAEPMVGYRGVVGRCLEMLKWYERLNRLSVLPRHHRLQMYACQGYGRVLRYLGRYREAEEASGAALNLAEREGLMESVGAVLADLGSLALLQGRFDAAKQLYQRSLEILRDLDCQYGTAVALNGLGDLANARGRYEEAKGVYEAGLALERRLGNHYGIALSLHNLGKVACHLGHFTRAIKLLEESLAIKREIGDRHGIAMSLNYLGIAARGQGNYEEALEIHERSLAIFREIGDRYGVARSLHNLAFASIMLGQTYSASMLLAEALRTAADIGASSVEIESLITSGLLLIASTVGPSAPAGLLLFGAQQQASRIGYALRPTAQAALDEGLALIRQPQTGLSAAEVTKIEEHAQAFSLADLADYALDCVAGLEAGN